eukprot:gene9799-biopygen12258
MEPVALALETANGVALTPQQARTRGESAGETSVGAAPFPPARVMFTFGVDVGRCGLERGLRARQIWNECLCFFCSIKIQTGPFFYRASPLVLPSKEKAPGGMWIHSPQFDEAKMNETIFCRYSPFPSTAQPPLPAVRVCAGRQGYLPPPPRISNTPQVRKVHFRCLY